jgi:tetratricopeptide (TPR) repeat protein
MANSAEPEWRELAEDCLAHAYAGEIDEAIEAGEAAVAAAEQAKGKQSAAVAACLVKLGTAWLAADELKRADKTLRRAVAIAEKVLPATSTELAECVHTLGNACFARGKIDEAQALYERALAIREQELGPEHPQVAKSLGDLANLYADGRQDVARADELLQRSRSILEKRVAGEPEPRDDFAEALIDLALVLNNLAVFRIRERAFEAAESLLVSAVDRLEQMHAVQCTPSPAAVDFVAENLIEVYEALGRDLEAGSPAFAMLARLDALVEAGEDAGSFWFELLDALVELEQGGASEASIAQALAAALRAGPSASLPALLAANERLSELCTELVRDAGTSSEREQAALELDAVAAGEISLEELLTSLAMLDEADELEPDEQERR